MGIDTPAGYINYTTPIKEFVELTTISNSQYILGIQNISTGNGARITFGNLITSIISSNSGNQLIKGTDNKLFISKPVEIGSLYTLTTRDKSNLVAAINEVNGKIDIDFVNNSKALTTGLISESPYVYADVFNYANSNFDKTKFTVTNSAKISDNGIASNFYLSGNDYGVVRTSENITFGYSTFDFYFKFTLPKAAPASNQNLITTNSIQGISFFLTTTPRIGMQLGNGSAWVTSSINGTNNLILGTSYLGRLSYYNGKYILALSSDNGITWTKECEYESINQFLPIEKLNFGGTRGGNGQFTGTLDLKCVKIIKGGYLYFSGNETGLDDIISQNYIKPMGTSVSVSTDGIATGFSSTNYLETPNINFHGKKLKIRTRFNTIGASLGTIGQYILNNAYVRVRLQYVSGEGKHYMSAYFSDGIYTTQPRNTLNAIQTDAEYIAEVEFVQGEYARVALYSVDGTLIESSQTSSGQTKSVIIPDTLLSSLIGFDGSNGFAGSIDLNELMVYVDDCLIYQSCLKIPYIKSITGSKIVENSVQQRITSMYEQFGYAPYYTIQQYTHSNFAVIGSPTISDDYSISNLSNSNKIYTLIDLNVNNFELDCTFNCTSLSATQRLFQYLQGLILQVNTDGTLRLYASSIGGNSWDIASAVSSTNVFTTGNIYRIQVMFTGMQYIVYVNGEAWITVDSTQRIITQGQCYLFSGDNGQPVAGSQDLKSIKFYINDKITYLAVVPANVTLPKGEVYGFFGNTVTQDLLFNNLDPDFDAGNHITFYPTYNQYTVPSDGYISFPNITLADGLEDCHIACSKNNSTFTLVEVTGTTSFPFYFRVSKGTTISVGIVSSNTIYGYFIPAAKGD